MMPPKLKLAVLLSVSFATSLMVFIYAPLDIYLHNPSEFVIGWRVMLLPLFATFLLCFAALFIVLLLMWHRKILIGIILIALCGGFLAIVRIAFLPLPYLLVAVTVAMGAWFFLIKFLKQEAVDVIVLILGGLLVAGYIQTLFFNENMSAIMGQQTEYNNLSPYNIFNLLLWIVVAIAPLCTFIIFKLIKKKFIYDKIFFLSLVIMSGMQIIGLVSVAITTDLPKGYDEEPVYFTYEAAVNFNSDENIIVLVLDKLDTRVVDAVFEYSPHLWDYFDGFTYYRNNTAEYFDTVTSVTSMLTRQHISPTEGGRAYIDRAWQYHNFIDTLKEHGFISNLYIDRVCSFNRYELIKDRADNTMYADRLFFRPRPFLAISARFSLGRASPYLLKNTWLSPIFTGFAGQYFYFEVDNDIAQFIPIVDIHSDMKFHRFLRQAEFSSDNENSVFIFMHFNSAHGNGDIDDPNSNGYHYDEASGEIRQGGSQLDILRASFEKLELYFNGIKEIGVYDNSTIIIVGDHGVRKQIPETTALLVKPKDATGALKVDALTELSHLYFQSSILDAAGLPYEEFGVSYFDIINALAPVPPIRTLYVPGKHAATPNARIYGDFGIWEVAGDANERDSWSFIPLEHDDFVPYGALSLPGSR